MQIVESAGGFKTDTAALGVTGVAGVEDVTVKVCVLPSGNVQVIDVGVIVI